MLTVLKREEPRKDAGRDCHDRRRSPSEDHGRVVPDSSRYASYREEKAEQKKRDDTLDRRIAKGTCC